MSTAPDSGPVSNLASARRRVPAPGARFEVAGVRLQVVRDIPQALLVAGIGNTRRLAANPARIAPQLFCPAEQHVAVFHRPHGPTTLCKKTGLSQKTGLSRKTGAVGERLTRRTACC